MPTPTQSDAIAKLASVAGNSNTAALSQVGFDSLITYVPASTEVNLTSYNNAGILLIRNTHASSISISGSAITVNMGGGIAPFVNGFTLSGQGAKIALLRTSFSSGGLSGGLSTAMWTKMYGEGDS